MLKKLFNRLFKAKTLYEEVTEAIHSDKVIYIYRKKSALLICYLIIFYYIMLEGFFILNKISIISEPFINSKYFIFVFTLFLISALFTIVIIHLIFLKMLFNNRPVYIISRFGFYSKKTGIIPIKEFHDICLLINTCHLCTWMRELDIPCRHPLISSFHFLAKRKIVFILKNPKKYLGVIRSLFGIKNTFSIQSFFYTYKIGMYSQKFVNLKK